MNDKNNNCEKNESALPPKVFPEDHDQITLLPTKRFILSPNTPADHSYTLLQSTRPVTFHIWTQSHHALHAHDNYYEIFVITSGKVIHSIDGEQSVLTSGDAVLISPGQHHQFIQYEGICSNHINLTCSLSCVQELFQFCCHTDKPPFTRNLVHLDTRCFEIVKNYQDIILRSPDQYFQTIAIKSLFSILVGLFCLVENVSEIPEWLRSFLAEVQNLCFDSSFKISDLYSIANCSRTTLSREFKNYMGQTLVSYITDLKLSHACNQLRNTDFSVLQIASFSGFDTYVHFARKFKEKYGCTPTEYRKNTH